MNDLPLTQSGLPCIWGFEEAVAGAIRDGAEYPVLSSGSFMCKTAQLYAMAQTSVFCRYPAWKLNAVREDRAEHRDSSILDSFAKDVENEVNLLEVIIPLVGQFCEWVCLRERIA